MKIESIATSNYCPVDGCECKGVGKLEIDGRRVVLVGLWDPVNKVAWIWVILPKANEPDLLPFTAETKDRRHSLRIDERASSELERIANATSLNQKKLEDAVLNTRRL